MASSPSADGISEYSLLDLGALVLVLQAERLVLHRLRPGKHR